MGQFHFDSDTYQQMIEGDVPHYHQLQDNLAACLEDLGDTPQVLDLGVGTGETTLRALARYPHAKMTGIDDNEGMLNAASERLHGSGVTLVRQRLQDELPTGPFDAVVSALSVHHLDGPGKADLFLRVVDILKPSGLFIMGDLVMPEHPVEDPTPFSPEFDLPDSIGDQLRWLAEAGFSTTVPWIEGDLAVFCAVRDS